MTRKLLLLVGLLFVPVSPALAEDASGDMMQTISDLRSQSDDKEKIDSLGATRVELSQIRTWLGDATNAMQEEAEEKARRIFARTRAQLRLVDQLIALSKVQDRVRKLERGLSEARQAAAAAKSELEEKRARLRALKMRAKGQ